MIDVNMGIHKIIQRVVFNENFKDTQIFGI